jgi:hypothetical protein
MQGIAQGLTYGILAIVVLVLVIRRQMVLRPLNVSRMLVIPGILIVVGLASGTTLFDRLDSPTAIVLLVAGLVVGVLGGAARAATQRLIWQNGVVYSRGTRWTLVLWLATVLVRVGMAGLGAVLHAPEGTGEVLLFLAVTLGVQNLLLARRAGLSILGTRPVFPTSPVDTVADPSPSVPVEK